MKKIAVLFFALVATVAVAQDDLSFENIRNGWMNSSIPAPGIGNNPSVIKLVAAFDKQWHTWMGESIAKKASAPGFTFYEDPEQFWSITYNAKNNNIFLNSSENEGGSLHATALPMKNGNTLLCVVIGTPYDEGDEIACYYEYDPAKASMKPWDGAPDTGYSKIYDKAQVSVSVPEDGETYFFQEYFLRETDDEEIFFNYRKYYKWDGERFVYDYPEIKDLDLYVIQYEEWWQSRNPKVDSHPLFGKIALADVDNDGVPEVFFTDDSETYTGVYALGTGKPLICACSDDKNSIHYYDRAISTGGVISEKPITIFIQYALLVESKPVVFLSTERTIKEKKTKDRFWLSRFHNDEKEYITGERTNELLGKIGAEQNLKINWRKFE